MDLRIFSGYIRCDLRLEIPMTNIQYDRTISPNENMVAPNQDAYFRTTEKAYECILEGLSSAGRDKDSIKSVLDFGCGHGRVYRILTAGFPNAEHTACDLIKDGAQFCAKTFGGSWVQSYEDASLTKFETKFDLIWIGSVFTHLPEPKWHSLLDFLATITEPGGVVVFTVHGKTAIEFFGSNTLKRHPHIMEKENFQYMKDNIENLGFYFSPQRDANFKYSVEHGMNVSAGEYGLTFTTEAWIRQMLAKKPEWHLAQYAAPGWGKNHDAVILSRK